MRLLSDISIYRLNFAAVALTTHLLSIVAAATFPKSGLLFWLMVPITFLVFLNQNRNLSSLKYCLREPLIILLLSHLFIFLSGIFFTDSGVEVSVYKDFARGGVLTIIALLILQSNSCDSERCDILRYFSLGVVALSFVAAVIITYRYSYIVMFTSGASEFRFSLTQDYNMSSLTLLLGFNFLIVFWLRNRKLAVKLVICLLAAWFISIGLHSGSRRFLVMLFISPFFFLALIFFFGEKLKLDSLANNISSLIFFIIALVLFNEFFSVLKIKNGNTILEMRATNFLNKDTVFGFLPRLERWFYAIELFVSERKWFWGDFNYRNNFGCAFLDCKAADYPHNFVLSALLYGGGAGAISALGFLAYPVFLLYKAPKYSLDLCLQCTSLVTVLGFTFISGDSLFSIPLFPVVLSLLVSKILNNRESTTLPFIRKHKT